MDDSNALSGWELMQRQREGVLYLCRDLALIQSLSEKSSYPQQDRRLEKEGGVQVPCSVTVGPN